MNISSIDQPRGIAVRITDDSLEVDLRDGRTIITPLLWYPRLHEASAADCAVWEWIGDGIGIHWPRLDEDLSVRGMLEGKPSFEIRGAATV